MTLQQHVNKNDPNAALCVMSAEIHASAAWRLAQFQQVVGCVGGLLSVAYFLFNTAKMPQLFGRVAQILIRWMIAFIMVHNVCLMIINVWLNRVPRFATTPLSCNELLVVTWQCLLLRSTTTACVTGMTAAYVLMTVDAFCQVYFPHVYDRYTSGLHTSAKIGISMVQIVMAIGPVLCVFGGENFTAYRVYCTPNSQRSSPRLGGLYVILLGVDLLCTFSFAIFTKRLFSGLKSHEHNFVLSRKLRMRANIGAMRFLVASAVLRLIFVCPFLLGMFAVRLFYSLSNRRFYEIISAIYVIEWYGIIFALLLFHWRPFRLRHNVNRITPLANEQVAHFERLRQMWE